MKNIETDLGEGDILTRQVKTLVGRIVGTSAESFLMTERNLNDFPEIDI